MRRSLSTYVRAVVATYRRRPADLLPFYVFGAAVATIARVFLLAGVVVAYLHLRATGALAETRDDLAAIDATPPETDDPEVLDEWATEVTDALAPLATPTAIAAVGLGALAMVCCMLVLSAAASAGQLSTCHARLRSERGLTAAIAGVRRRWLTFLGLYLLELACWIASGIAIALVAVVLGAAVALATGSGGAGLVLGLVGVLVWIVVVAAIRAVFAFAPVAAVVDDAGVGDSVSAAASFVRRQPVGAGFYYVVAIAGLVGVGALTSMAAIVGAQSVGSVVTLLLVLPALDLLKTVLYGDDRGAVSPPAPTGRSVREQLGGGLRLGWGATVAFVREHPGANLLALATMLAGFAMGWLAADPFAGAVETSIAGRLEGHVAPAAALNFFANNWTVALTTAFSGLALGVPAIVSLWFNGAFFGIYGRLEVAPTELLAFVAPHGILEIPAIVVAGAVGIVLGGAWWRTWRGQATRAELADAVERAFWVLVGLGIVLAIAGAIEGFVSPYYYRPFL